jgi:ZIP family zinc transporter
MPYGISRWVSSVASFSEMLFLSAIMGLSIYISLPFVLRRRTDLRATVLLNALAIGILIFLMGDVFSDVAPLLNNGSLYGYGTSLFNDFLFGASFTAGFSVLYAVEMRSKTDLTPTLTALIIALGIGFQNLTEGLVFGALGVTFGFASGAALVVLMGFLFQNVTEGFPIASPFLGGASRRVGVMSILFLLGGIPTIIGGAVGFYYNLPLFEILFDGLAVGSILYVLAPMFKSIFRQSVSMQRLIYVGLCLGFMMGFVVNLI